jgi:hypothetical protein
MPGIANDGEVVYKRGTSGVIGECLAVDHLQGQRIGLLHRRFKRKDAGAPGKLQIRFSKLIQYGNELTAIVFVKTIVKPPDARPAPVIFPVVDHGFSVAVFVVIDMKTVAMENMMFGDHSVTGEKEYVTIPTAFSQWANGELVKAGSPRIKTDKL